MPAVLRAPRQLLAALDAYERGFDWFCLCLACGHDAPRGHEDLQRLYQLHGRLRTDGSELGPLVGEHWNVLNAAYELAAAPLSGRAWPAHRLRAAQAVHRAEVAALRRAWAA